MEKIMQDCRTTSDNRSVSGFVPLALHPNCTLWCNFTYPRNIRLCENGLAVAWKEIFKNGGVIV